MNIMAGVKHQPSHSGLGPSSKRRNLVRRLHVARAVVINHLAVEAAKKLNIKLKIAGAPAGYYTGHKKLQEGATDNIEFLGRVSDEELVTLYSQAKAFLALATDEDFGITPVEAMLCGTPVIAYFGGGYKETVIEGKTGLFFHESTVSSLTAAIKKFEKMNFDPKECRKQAEKFSKERFIKEIKEFIRSKVKKINDASSD